MLLHVGLPFYIRLRHLAGQTYVFVLDAQASWCNLAFTVLLTSSPQIGTAAAAFMAIRVLLDHGVQEDRIIFVTFLVAREGGVSVLKRAFPGVKIVCGAVDNEMEEAWLEGYKGEGNPEGMGRQVWVMKPGMGQIGAKD